MLAKRKIVLGLLVLTVVMSVLAVHAGRVTAQGPTFYGQRFGQDNGHHYVEFRVNACARDWRVTGPSWSWWNLELKLWAFPDGYGIARAGFRWPDWLPVEWFLRPSQFQLYPVR